MENIEKLLGYHFCDKSLLDRALTHSTYGNEHKIDSGERLEFLGDSVLELIVREKIYHLYKEDEGKLTEWKKQIVDKYSLSEIVEKLGLMQHLKIGGSLKKQELSTKLKSDVFESVLGAIYLDGGLDSARNFVCQNIDFEAKISFLAENNLDYKTTLQELVQKEHIRPSYIDLEKEDELFVRAVVIDDKIVATGSGKTKQEADKVAAKNAINILKGN